MEFRDDAGGGMLSPAKGEMPSMPMIAIRYADPGKGPETPRRLAALAARLAAEHLGKDPAVTAVLAEPADPAAWFVAGRSLAEHGLGAYWLDIKVTAGTNTRAETTAFLAALHGGMEAILGPLHEESYALVHAADGHAYGYGGRSQEGRWAAANPG